MAINQLESNLEAITRTIAHLEREGNADEKELMELKKETHKILEDLQII